MGPSSKRKALELKGPSYCKETEKSCFKLPKGLGVVPTINPVFLEKNKCLPEKSRHLLTACVSPDSTVQEHLVLLEIGRKR